MSFSSSNTKIGPKQTNHELGTNKLQYNLHKLSPLPIFQKNLLNSSRLRERLQVDNHKFFAKLSASGPETWKILHGIKRSYGVKFVQKFEFDPYLCDHSHLNHLRRICHKIKDLTHLDLVIRRVDFPDEVEVLSPSIARFLRMKSIRIEFPRTQNVNENDFIQLHKAIGNCSHLKLFEWKAIGMPERSPDLQEACAKYMRRLQYLECLKGYEALKKGTLKRKVSKSKALPLARRFSVKIVDFTISSAGEWGNKEIESEPQTSNSGVLGQIFMRLEKARMRLIKATVGFQDLITFFSVIAMIPTLHHFEYELLNCQIGDMEITAFAHGLTKAKQLRYFNLKVIQKPGISEDCIERFAGVLSKIDHLLKFDIYITRLGLHPRGLIELGKRIRNFENIECSCSKESIHIYRRVVGTG